MYVCHNLMRWCLCKWGGGCNGGLLACSTVAVVKVVRTGQDKGKLRNSLGADVLAVLRNSKNN